MTASPLDVLLEEVEIGDTGQTAGELLRSIRAEAKTLNSYADGLEWDLRRLDGTGVELYFQIAE